MKISTLIVILMVSLSLTLDAQVNAGQIDDFENGTTQNWTDGGSAVPPVNVSTGGPMGAGDNYLSDPSTGGGGPGSKMVMFNDQQWAGNYTSAGILSIKFFARALTNNLNIRVAFDGAGGRICTTNAVLVPANSPWTQYSIDIQASDFTTVAGGSNIGATLADVSDMRILSNTVPSWQGESIVATLEIDNIEASTTLSTSEFEQSKLFSLVPNISDSELQVSLMGSIQTDNPIMEIYDLSGKLVMSRPLNATDNLVGISNLAKGLYIFKLRTDSYQQIERFIKL